MTKDIYKTLGEQYSLDKHDRKDVKVGAVAVLQGECLTPQERVDVNMDENREWRTLLAWQKEILTKALVEWLRQRKCDKILEKIEAMDPRDRQKFLSEAIRTKKKSFPRSSGSVSSVPTQSQPPIIGSPMIDDESELGQGESGNIKGEEEDPRTIKGTLHDILN